MKALFLGLILCLLTIPKILLAEPSDWSVYSYSDEKKGSVILYEAPSPNSIQVNNTVNILTKEFYKMVNNLPDKAVIGVISSDGRKSFLFKWDLKENSFLMIEVFIPETKEKYYGKYTLYPDPLERIKDIILARKFPNPEKLPLYKKNKIKSNYIETSVLQLKALLKGEF